MPRYACRLPGIPDSEKLYTEASHSKVLLDYGLGLNLKVGQHTIVEIRNLDDVAWTTHRVQRAPMKMLARTFGSMIVTEKIEGVRLVKEMVP